MAWPLRSSTCSRSKHAFIFRDGSGCAHGASLGIAVIVIVTRAILTIAQTAITAGVARDLDCVVQRHVGAWVVLGGRCY